MPKIAGLLETALYVEDLALSAAFYRGTLQLAVMFDSPRLVALDAGRQGVLLLFRKGASAEDVPTNGGIVPGHHGDGSLHMAFAITAEEYEPWRQHLSQHQVAIRSEVTWPAGGRSLYFDDPDGHVIELATPGLWANY